MTSTMVFAISTTSSSTGVKTSSHCYFPNSAISIPRNSVSQQIKCIPHLGFAPFSQWNGLKHMGISILQYSVKIEKKGKRKGKGVYASLFGVGAPEVLVIGVVALLVFGPKGLAEVARNLGKTLRAFQPTIRELQEVSREFKSTLEREIGLDDIDNPVPKSPISNPNKPTSEDKPMDSGANIEPSKCMEL
ncbi:sec-independent protein translocase protein tatb chloroplastic [Phtheirospermum japonicum]|uniref:Sec-independent protein translocase protein tatb chloroplastic n=1 Tax=Phtheirospermum japonicum TaxID=374723 RepID=A0A830B8L7_9LAMI|nr:sec-independent protein translocase protein tatb chloroplastic [Phtheirospermum japonicum]GFQ08403.1 sec-independent protein translocase protein tatb chloroplastic [Phtheirospermum japonicum]